MHCCNRWKRKSDSGFLANIKYKKKPDPFLSHTVNVNSATAATKFTLTDNRNGLGAKTRVLKIPFNAFTFSVGTTPMRFRAKTDSSSSTVSATLNLSLGFGYTFGRSYITGRSINNYSVTIAPFIGLATAELKKETVKTPKIWDNNKTYTRINPALSYGLLPEIILDLYYRLNLTML